MYSAQLGGTCDFLRPAHRQLPSAHSPQKTRTKWGEGGSLGSLALSNWETATLVTVNAWWEASAFRIGRLGYTCMTSSHTATSFVDRARSGLKLGRHSMFKIIPLLKDNTLRFLRKLMFSMINIRSFLKNKGFQLLLLLAFRKLTLSNVMSIRFWKS